MPDKRFFHVGIAVSDIESATDFFQRLFGLQLVQSRTINHHYLGTLVGVPGIRAQVNMLEMDKDCYLEILQWELGNTFEEQAMNTMPRIFDSGAQHLCLYTVNAEDIFHKMKLEAEVKFISDSLVVVESGPNSGAKVFFVRVFGFLYLEIFEKPAR